jgi:hypothetical protein
MNADMTIFPWLRTPAHPERTGFLARKSEDPMNPIFKFFAIPDGIKAQRDRFANEDRPARPARLIGRNTALRSAQETCRRRGLIGNVRSSTQSRPGRLNGMPAPIFIASSGQEFQSGQ